MEFFVIGVIIAVIIAAAFGFSKSGSGGNTTAEPPHRIAGRQGERVATRYIESILREGDTLFTNVSVSYDGRSAELDNVIVNKYGVFIIEVKNYSGRLSGSEDDYEWTKVHISKAGNRYVKSVKNPIKQVKREVYILAKFLDYHGASVWVEGYAMIIDAASPTESKFILSSLADIDRAVHTSEKRRLNSSTVDAVKKLLSQE